MARRQLTAVLVFSSLLVSGCASVLVPPRQLPVTLTTTRATAYYSVRGTTTREIFEEIKAHGLFEQDGEHALGLTSSNSQLALKAYQTDALCVPDSATIILDLVVTLPRHDGRGALSANLQERWDRFAAAVAAHEEHHVDIFVNGVNAVKPRVESILKKEWPSCADLETTIHNLWKSQATDTERAHREFDAADRARLDNDRKAVQAEIETRTARLAGLTAELQGLERTVETISRRAATVRERIEAVIANIEEAKGNCSRPTDRIQTLCVEYNTLAATHDALVAQHTSLVAHGNGIVGEHNRLLESTNELIESLNWVY